MIQRMEKNNYFFFVRKNKEQNKKKMLLYLIHSFLLPLSSSSYNSKLLKMVVLNLWMFTFIHSVRVMLNVTDSEKTYWKYFLSIIATLLFVVSIGTINFLIFISDEHYIYPSSLVESQQIVVYGITLLTICALYLFAYFKFHPEKINIDRIYQGVHTFFYVSSLIYLILNYRYLNQGGILLRNTYSVFLSKMFIVFSFLMILSFPFLNRFLNIPLFFLLFPTFVFYNFQLYKYLNNGLMVSPVFNKYYSERLSYNKYL